MNEIVAGNSITAVFIATTILIILAIICLKIKSWTPNLLKVFYILILVPVVITTGYLAYSTIHLNLTSSSGGPVHWHADFEIWDCGQQLDLINPTGWSNRVGTPTLHEHGESRIHLEGVVYQKDDDSLGKFFKVVGGQITKDTLILPTNQGKKLLVSGEKCPDGSVAKLQVFVYKVTGQNYFQQKITAPASYTIAPQSQVPPGDCIIVEYGPEVDKTDKLCRSYKVAKQIGKLGEELP